MEYHELVYFINFINFQSKKYISSKAGVVYEYLVGLEEWMYMREELSNPFLCGSFPASLYNTRAALRKSEWEGRSSVFAPGECCKLSTETPQLALARLNSARGCVF